MKAASKNSIWRLQQVKTCFIEGAGDLGSVQYRQTVLGGFSFLEYIG